MTRRGVLDLSLGGVTTMLLSRGSRAGNPVERADLNAIFQENGVVGTFVLHDVLANRLTMVNPQRARRVWSRLPRSRSPTASSRSKPAS
jgi:hypothetical protein